MSAKIPLWLKITYTVMVCIIIPIYWKSYGPTNFLWFSDVALILMLPALWLENRLIPSMMAIGVLPLDFCWMIDFFSKAKLMGITHYMFLAELPLYLRGLSLFHIPLPFIILFALYKLGYDSRARAAQIRFILVLLPVTYLIAPIERNINWVHGWGQTPQKIFVPEIYLILLIIVMATLIIHPMHLFFSRIFTAHR